MQLMLDALLHTACHHITNAWHTDCALFKRLQMSVPSLQIWGMIPDLTGGFNQLSSAYQDFVSQNMNSVLALHTAIFVIW
jgi:hypothetical protein